MDLKQKEDLYLKAKDAYYKGKPLMSDAQFDILETELSNSKSTIIKVVGSKKGGTIAHHSPMLSLGKINVLDNDAMEAQIKEVDKWIKTIPTYFPLVIEATGKYDGNAMSLGYEHSKLFQALTRGDGEKGFDMVHKLLHFVPNILKVNPFHDSLLEIRGEILIPTDLFNAKYLGEFKNARNFVAGMLSRDEVNINIMKELEFAAYELKIHDDSGDIRFKDGEKTARFKTLDTLSDMGFNQQYPIYKKYFTDIKEFKSIYLDFMDYRDNRSPFLLDGMVLKAHEDHREPMGYTDHHPKWAIAIKFPPTDAFTEIISIDWKTGSSGTVVPTAVMKPVDVDGTTIRRATLFNWGNVYNFKNSGKAAVPGAKVRIAKAGDIIPQIYDIVTPAQIKYDYPSHCPACGNELYVDNIHLICDNENCIAQKLVKIEHGLKVLGVKNVGGSAIKKLYAAGITDIIQYFDQKQFNELSLIKTGEFVKGRSLEVIIEAIAKIESVGLSNLIQSLEFNKAGKAICDQVARYISGVEYTTSGLNREVTEKLMDKSSKEFDKIYRFINTLNDNFVEVKYERSAEELENIQTYEMTGTPPEIGNLKSKNDFGKYLQKHGYEHDKLTKNSSFLLTNSYASTSGKMAKVDKINKKYDTDIKIYTYEDFIKNVIEDEKIFESTPSVDDKKDKKKKPPTQVSTLF